MALALTKENFDAEVSRSSVPVLVDFWAEWCGPCKMVASAVEEVAREYQGKVKVAKLNVDDSPELASSIGIMSIPTFIVFRNGKEEVRKVGALSKAELTKTLQPYIKKA